MTLIDQPPPGPGTETARALRRLKRWFDRLPHGMTAAILFSYWLALAGLALMAGLRITGALMGSAFMVGIAYLSFRAMRWTQPLAERSVWTRLAYVLALSCTAITVGLAVVMPAILLLGMAAWGILTGLLWLIRL